MTPEGSIAPTLVALGLSIAVLLTLIIRFRLPAFFSLIAVSILSGFLFGLQPGDILDAIQTGMGNLVGYIAVIIGLGSIFGALLEKAGAIDILAERMTRHGGVAALPWQTSALGVIIAIPVFFDVAFIILASLVHRLSASVRRHVFFVAGPLLAGLAAAHAFVPPTPGPVAVAAVLDAELGTVIIFGLLAAIPAVAIAGPLFATALYNKPPHNAPSMAETGQDIEREEIRSGFAAAMTFLAIPLVLIAGGSILQQTGILSAEASSIVVFVSHPFTALLLCVGAFYAYSAWIVKMPLSKLNEAAATALEPAGAVVLVTGAGGVFKQVLTQSGAGVDIANAIAGASMPIMVFAFVTAALVRTIQGSATVAMVTAAGLCAPLLGSFNATETQRALAVVSIASGATVLSHVNDSGFWLVSRYLNMTESETLRSWTIVSTLVGCSGFAVVLLLSMVD